MKRLILVLAILILITPALAWRTARNIYINSSAGSGGDGSESSPYDQLSDINWSAGGDNSIYHWVAAGDDVFIKLACGSSWSETLTVGTSGASGHPITIQSYGEGDAPLINADGIQYGININEKNHIIYFRFCASYCSFSIKCEC